MLVVKQHVGTISAAIAVLIITLGGAYAVTQQAQPTCAGVTQNPNGTYAFSWLHVSSDGILRDKDNCEVVLNGFNWGVGHGHGVPGGGTGPSLTQQDADFAAFRTKMGANIVRINFNTKWWVDNDALVAPQWTGSGTCVVVGQAPTIGCHHYRDWIGWLIDEMTAHGMYAELSPDEMFPEQPNCTETYFGFAGVQCSNGGQGDYDYDNAATCTGTGCGTPTCSGNTCTAGCTNSSGAATACQFAPWVNGGSCTTTCTAVYYHNPYVCYDSAVISSTVQTYDTLAQTYALSPSVIFQTWNEPYSGGCGRSANTDADVTGTGGKVVYTDEQTLVNSLTATPHPTVHEPCFGVAGGTGSTCPESGGLYDHMMTIADVARNRDPNALVVMGGPQYSNSAEPVTGNPTDPTHFGGSGSEIGGAVYPVLPPYPEANLVLEHHWYYNNWHMSPGNNYPTRGNGEAQNGEALGFATQIGEWGDNKVRDGDVCADGTQASPSSFCPTDPATNNLDWSVMCYPLAMAKRNHMGEIYFYPGYISNQLSDFGGTLNGAGLALQQDMAWMRGNPNDPNYVSQPVYWDGTTNTTKTCGSQY